MILGVPEGLVWALVGTIVGFLLNGARQRWRDKRERKTLVRALSAEIEHNEKVAENLEERWGWRDLKNMINDPDLPSISNDRWRDSQGKTHLLPPQLGEVLQRYYSAVQTLLTFLNFRRDKRMNQQMNLAIRNLYAEGLPEQDEVRGRLMRTDPYIDALSETLAAQDEARKRVDEYLVRRRPWWRRLFQA